MLYYDIFKQKMETCSIRFSCCVLSYFTIKQIKDSFSLKKVTWALWDEILSVRLHHEILSAVVWLHGASICCKRMGFSAFQRHLGKIYITELYIYDHYNDTWDFVPKPVIPIHVKLWFINILTLWSTTLQSVWNPHVSTSAHIWRGSQGFQWQTKVYIRVGDSMLCF